MDQNIPGVTVLPSGVLTWLGMDCGCTNWFVSRTGSNRRLRIQNCPRVVSETFSETTDSLEIP